MKKTYVYDRKTGRMVEKTSMYAQRKGPYVIGDIQPYQAAGPEYGKWITSRSQHREYLRRHNLLEVGNEKKYLMPDSGEKK